MQIFSLLAALINRIGSFLAFYCPCMSVRLHCQLLAIAVVGRCSRSCESGEQLNRTLASIVLVYASRNCKKVVWCQWLYWPPFVWAQRKKKRATAGHIGLWSHGSRMHVTGRLASEPEVDWTLFLLRIEGHVVGTHFGRWRREDRTRWIQIGHAIGKHETKSIFGLYLYYFGLLFELPSSVYPPWKDTIAPCWKKKSKNHDYANVFLRYS